MLRHLAERGADLATLARRVTGTVLSETAGGQRPWQAGSLRLEHYLVPEGFAGAGEDTPASLALVFYSGHGLAVEGRRYLAPVDIDFGVPEAAASAVAQSVPLDDVLSALPAADLQVVLLDAMFADMEPASR